MTKDEALKRFQQAKQRKHECLAKLEKSMKESYEEKTMFVPLRTYVSLENDICPLRI